MARVPAKWAKVMADKRLKVSHSALSTYWKCPEMYRKIYVAKEVKKVKSMRMVVGIAAHAAQDYGLKQKKIGNKPILANMFMVAEAAFDKESKSVQYEDDISLVIGDGPEREASLEKVHRAVQTIHDQLLPHLHPLESEYHFKVEWRPGVDIEGYMDCVEEIGNTHEIAVRDLKIGGERTPYKDGADQSIQLAIYAIMWWRIRGKMPKLGVLDNYVDSKRPHFTPRYVEFDEKRLRAVELRVDRTIDAILAEQYPPADPFWTCKPLVGGRGCEFYRTCPMGAGK